MIRPLEFSGIVDSHVGLQLSQLYLDPGGALPSPLPRLHDTI